MKKLIISTVFIIFLKISISAQVAVNTTSSPANFSAMLDVSSTNKGILIPRVALTGALDNSTVPSPVVSLLIYNTANTGSGISAIVPGFYYWSGSKWAPISSSAGSWSVAGNSGTSPNNNFIGTTDNQPLKFRVNNLAAGELNPSTGNISIGLNSMTALPESHNNIAIGNSALEFNNTYSNLVAVGDSALYSTGSVLVDGINPIGNTAVGSKALYANYAGYYNTATGFNSLKNNTEGYRNTASGAFALRDNTTGNGNTATGFTALSSNNQGYANTAMGSFALSLNSSGNDNTAFGSECLEYNFTGINNTAVGSHALLNSHGSNNSVLGYLAAPSATGNWNTAIGSNALLNTNIGQANVAIGFRAMQYNTSGDNNTAIGTNAGPTNGLGIWSNSTAIGQTATYTASNQVRVGNTAVTAIGGYADFVNISDIRFKKNVQPETHGLDFILKLQPIMYNMDVHKLNNFIYGAAADTLFKGTAQQAITDKEAILYSGFSAQQVEETANRIGYNFSGVQKPQNEHDHYALAYSQFVVPLVKAVQEQQELIKNLELRIAALEKK